MSSRSTYTAITPEYADFPLHAELEHDPSRSSVEEEGSIPLRIHSWLASAKDVVQMNTGLLLFIAAQAFYTFMNLAVKVLNTIDPPITTLELITVRMIFTYVCSVAYMAAANIPDPILGPKGVRLLLLLRGFFGFFGLFGIYYSLQYLSLSDATVLTFLAPICTAMAGALFLGENFPRREAFAGLVSLVGVVLIARPTVIFGSASHLDPHVEKGTQAERLIAVGIALIGVLGSSGTYTTIRAIGTRAHPMHAMTFFSSMCIVVSTVAMIATKTPIVVPTRIDWLALLLMIGTFGFVAQILMTMGLQRETAGRGSIGLYTQIVFATILEKIVFNTVPSVLSITGTLLILVSAIYVALTKEKPTRAPKDVDLAHLSQDTELEEGLLHSQRRLGVGLFR